MIKIGLFCCAGMSTSLLVNKMRESAKERNIEVEINAYPESELISKVDDIDVALLGPQVKFMLKKAQDICLPKNVAIEVINTVDYGMMNGASVLDKAIELNNK